MITFTVTDDATPRVRAFQAALRSSALKLAAGNRLRQELRTYLAALPPNKTFPEATTGFYQTAADSVTTPQTDGEMLSNSITQPGLLQRYAGGTIKPKNGTYLTIPAQASAYGKLASEFSGNVKFSLVRDEDGSLRPALIAADGSAGTSGVRTPGQKSEPIGPDQVLYWLARSVTQEGDPTVLPPPEDLQNAAMTGMRDYIRAHLSGIAGNTSNSEEAS